MIEKMVKSNTIYKGKIINVRCDDIVLENGTLAKREVVNHRGGVCALVKTKDNKIIFVEQYRYAIGSVVLEMPAGKIETISETESENPDEAIKRELIEEVGVKTDKIINMGYMLPTPGYSSEKIYLYYVDEYENCNTHFDEDEDLSAIYIDIDEAYKMLDENKIIDGKTICLLGKCRKFLKK